MAANSQDAGGASPIVLVVSENHSVHSYRERGYTEVPQRVERILAALRPTGMFRQVRGRSFPEKHLHAVHGPEFLRYLKRACAEVPKGSFVCADTFPIGDMVRPPRSLLQKAGCYCLDSFTPLHGGAYAAARRAVDWALTAADAVAKGRGLAYAFVRPPGHHAERHCFGGYCYLNSTAVAAQYLSGFRDGVIGQGGHRRSGLPPRQRPAGHLLAAGRRADRLAPRPSRHRLSLLHRLRSGARRGPGEGFNRNFPLPASVDGPRYRRALGKAVRAGADFQPAFLVVALGLDTAEGDPCGTWGLGSADFRADGRMLGQLRLPTLVVQEGGYRLRTLGAHARSFFEGLLHGIG